MASAVFTAQSCIHKHFLSYTLPKCFASSQLGHIFDTVCDGCDVSCREECSFGVGKTPLCTEEFEDSKSTGGNITLETLSIDPGYWRSTTFSRDVFLCYNADACLGGVTVDPGYCQAGFEGPCERRWFGTDSLVKMWNRLVCAAKMYQVWFYPAPRIPRRASGFSQLAFEIGANLCLSIDTSK